MQSTDNRIQSTIKSIIITNLTILLIIFYWVIYSTIDMVFNLIIICISIITIGISLIVSIYKAGLETSNLAILGILIAVLFFFLMDVVFYLAPNTQPILFSFYNLIGLKHSVNFTLFFFLSLIVFIKIIIIYIYVKLNPEILKRGRGDAFFQYFTNDLNKKKKIYLLVLFPLSAFIEEVIYRGLSLSFLVYYFNFNLFFGIMVASFLFALVHYSSSNDSGYTLSLVISSMIYFVALIELGLLSAWIFHLATNLFVLLFYYQGTTKVVKIKS